MTIVLLILKMIGIVLLVLLGLFVLLSLLILFVPVRYQAQGEYHRDALWSVKLKVGWLLRLVSFTADLRAEGNDIGLRIFGIKIKMNKSDGLSDYEEAVELGDSQEKAESEADKSEETKEGSEDKKGSGLEKKDELKSESEKLQFAKEVRITDSEADKNDEKKSRGRKHIFRKLMDKPREIRQKLVETVRRIRAAMKNFVETAGKIKALFGDARNYAAVRFLGGRIFFLLKKLCPKKLTLNLQFSTGAPDTTGELLGVMAMFPICYQDSWNITPDFEADEAYVETDFALQGRMFMFRFLGVGISILVHKDCRYLYKKLKNIF